jgi:hypothetical protein
MSTMLFYCPCGPRISYEKNFDGEMFIVKDLNPENSIEFRMTPWELFNLGFRCIWASL